jgi:predicted transcriptional regulator
MSKVVSLRLPDATAARLQKLARRAGRSVSEFGARSLEEWLRQNEFADIEFREFNGERHACVKGALQVWQVVMVAEGYGLDPQKTAAYFDWPIERVQAALNYYAAYPEEIDQVIAENDAITFEDVQRLLPHARLFTFDRGPEEAESLV